MSTAGADAIGMACVAGFFLIVSGLAFRLQVRRGQRSQWRYIGLIVAAAALAIMIVNLNGVGVSGG